MKEMLAVPEEHLEDVIKVIREGILSLEAIEKQVHPTVVEQLWNWCEEEEEYLTRLSGETAK